MAAAEKFKAPEQQPPVVGETPASAAVETIHDSEEEEVSAAQAHSIAHLLMNIYNSPCYNDSGS